ncbi:histidine kinase/DNA gyrase B/HSP90-like ATPase [Nonomuraea polychroma]|uniref:Oxygen sensor histidine kinase NreB n=2 Tax=Nonomuraea polychroma TaxID=46176 RepID=A0A438MI13_9ACTN|nr:sensor histidine kinase [Nonomuraea polychroma]RVX45105.1 histidine kinase/DNA gyrase B/HSP90-like ATPase [Nonomuraea polychroma]
MRAALAWAVFGLACVLIILGGSSGEHLEDVAIALGFVPLGAYLVARRQGGVVGPLCLLAVFSAVAYAAEAHPAAWAVWVARWVWAPPLLVVCTVLLLHVPDGELPGRRWRPVVYVSAVATAVFTLLVAFAPEEGNPLGLGALRPVMGALAPVLVVLVLIAAACAVGLIVRTVRARGQRRLQLLWICVGAVCFVASVFAPSVVPPYVLPLTLAGMFALPVSIAVAMLRHDLYQTGPLLRRFLTYGLLAALMVGLYAAVLAGASALLDAGPSAAVAAGAVAIAVEPVRRWLARAAGRMLYGGHGDPLEIQSRLAGRLAEASAPGEILAVVADAAAEALRTPYTRVRLGPEQEPLKSVERGQPAQITMSVPLRFQGEELGRLDVAGGDDVRALEQIALQAGAALAAAHRAAALQHSRLQLVTTREEERRRITRDLHDGLGPVLAGIGFTADAARNALEQDPRRALTLIGEIRAQVGEAGQSVRHLVRGLRPPELAQLGIVKAVEQTALGLRMEVSIDADGVAELGAAVEVAAYHVVREALTNAARHASAAHCAVRLRRCGGTLEIEVADDGTGIPERTGPGIGLTSMRERVEELDGAFSIGAGPRGGTVVRAVIPVQEREDW